VSRAAVPRSGTPEKSAAPSRPAHERPPAARDVVRRRLLTCVAVAAAVVLLFVAYLRISRTYTENSDSANILLMSWDMLHGNLLLHGWYLSDVSFYPTELPQYAALEALLGLHADTAHVAAAMTYTLVLLFAVLLARGRTSGRPVSSAWPPMALTACLMIAPQLGVGVFVLLLSVGHIGTAIPLMLTWLVIDWAGSKPCLPGGPTPPAPPARAWFIPVIVGLLLTWVLVADPLVLVVGIVPLAAVCAVRVIRAVLAATPRDRGAALQARWYEVSLAAAAILAYGLADLVNRLLSANGGFVLHLLGYQLAPVHTWPKHAWVTGEGLLALFGAKPQGPAAELAFALLHLAGVALVAWAMCRVARRFLSWPDLISQVLLVAIVLNVLVYVPSTLADATDLNAREFAVVLPFAAVLAGRVLAGPLAVGVPDGQPAIVGWLRGARWRAGLAGALAVGYLASLGYAAAQPPVPPANVELAAFLADHHLTSGIAGYWQSSIVTVDSNGAVTVRAVWADTLRPYPWEAKASWYDPRSNRATFLVTERQPGFFNYFQPGAAALARYGPPARTYQVGPYTVLVWDKNLLDGPG
jgi:hypothetical protein